jgi:hypothetical protein
VRSPEGIVVLAVSVALIGTTTVALAAAASTSDEWTAAGQVLAAVGRGGTCGIADGGRTPDARSLTRLEPWPGAATPRSDERAIASTSESRWYRVPREGIGVFIKGDWDHERLVVSWGKSSGDRARVLASGPADLTRAQVGAIPASWWFVSETSFPGRPPEADLVRISDAPRGPGSRGRVSQPFSYEARGLSALINGAGIKTLSSPYLFEALPCARLPRLELGVAEPPNLLIDGGPPPLTIVTSPFIGITDMYTVWKTPVVSRSGRGTSYPWDTVSAYWVVADPRDAIAPAVRHE